MPLGARVPPRRRGRSAQRTWPQAKSGTGINGTMGARRRRWARVRCRALGPRHGTCIGF